METGPALRVQPARFQQLLDTTLALLRLFELLRRLFLLQLADLLFVFAPPQICQGEWRRLARLVVDATGGFWEEDPPLRVGLGQVVGLMRVVVVHVVRD